MRVMIWANKKDVVLGKINPSDYYTEDRLPTGKYVQISITVDEFTRLDDNGGYNQGEGRSEKAYSYCNEWKKEKI